MAGEEERTRPTGESLLFDLVDAVLDRRPLDWKAAETLASESQRTLIAQLRSVAAIASFNAESSGGTAMTDGVLPRASWAHLDLLESIGRGAFATVYRAWDPQLQREVALKLLPAGRSEDAAALAEGRLLARLRHPNVVTIHGADSVDGFVGLWMELVRGNTLEEIVTQAGPLDPQRVETIGTQLCDAVSAVHRAGLVHRDVKAHNVMIDGDGRLVLMDFGNGRAIDELSDDDIAGTPLYLPPEAFVGARPDTRGDQYAVAVLLYYLLTSRYPIDARDLKDVRAAHAHDRVVRDVRAVRADVPRRLATAIARGLAADPSARFDSVDAMARALSRSRTTTADAVRWGAAGIAVASAVALIAAGSVRDLVRRLTGRPPALNVRTAPGGPTPSARRIDVTGRWGPGALSRDGKYLALVVGDGPAVLDLTTGDTRRLREGSGQVGAEFAVASPDGQSIAYVWWPGGDGPYEVRAIDRSGRDDRLIFRADIGDTPWLYDWSRDGSQILAKLSSGDGRRRIALIDVPTGTSRIVREIGHGDTDLMSLSVDGRYISYDLPDDGTPPRTSIRIADTSDGSERILLPNEHTDNRFALWRGDGRSIFFLSDRSGTVDGWVVPVIAGTASGEPQVAARNLGPISALGMADSGTVYYEFQAGQFDLYEAALDPVSMTLASQPRPIRGRRQGSNIGPSYSHDGRRLAYLSQHTAFGGKMARRTIVVRDLAMSEEHELAAPLEPGMSGPSWSPDDRSLLVSATNRSNQWGLFVIDANTGRVQRQIIWRRGNLGDGIRAGWTTDGTSVLFTDPRGLVAHRLEDGDERVVLSSERIPSGPRLNTFAYSHDGGRLAFTEWNRTTAIGVVDADGIVRELVTGERPRAVTFQGWFPAGDYLLYSVSGRAPRQPDELWRIPVSGGMPQPVGLSINAITHVNTVSLHPSGTAVAYTDGRVQYELWMIENALPR